MTFKLPHVLLIVAVTMIIAILLTRSCTPIKKSSLVENNTEQLQTPTLNDTSSDLTPIIVGTVAGIAVGSAINATNKKKKRYKSIGSTIKPKYSKTKTKTNKPTLSKRK